MDEQLKITHRHLPHWTLPGSIYFVTFCKLTKEPFLDRERGIILAHCLHDHRKRLEMHAAVVMPELVHLLLTPWVDAAGWPLEISRILKMIKGTSARSVNELRNSGGPVWQDESFDHVLRSNENLHEKVEYIRQNPVRRRLVQRPEDYPWLWIGPTLMK